MPRPSKEIDLKSRQIASSVDTTNLMSDIRITCSKLEIELVQIVLLGKSKEKTKLIEAFHGHKIDYNGATSCPVFFDFRSSNEPAASVCDLEAKRPPTRCPAASEEDMQFYCKYFEVDFDRSVDGSVKPPVHYLEDHSFRLTEREKIYEIVNELRNKVARDPVYVRIEDRSCVDIQIVDLPPVFEYPRLVENYVSQEKSILVCVSDKNDLAHIGFCQHWDPYMERTILCQVKEKPEDDDFAIQFGIENFVVCLPEPKENYASELRRVFTSQSNHIANERNISRFGFGNFVDFLLKRVARENVRNLPKIRHQLINLGRNYLAVAAQPEFPVDVLRLQVKICSFYFVQGFARNLFGDSRDSEGSILNDLLVFESSLLLETFSPLKGPDHIQNRRPEESWKSMSYLPSGFTTLEEYAEYVEDQKSISKFHKMTGGFHRVLFEVEIFYHFLEFEDIPSTDDINQSLGFNMMRWRNSNSIEDIAYPLLFRSTYWRILDGLRYVVERFRHFFQSQKDAIAFEHDTFRDNSDTEVFRNIIYSIYDRVVDEKCETLLKYFLEKNELLFSNPFSLFDTRTQRQIDEDLMEEANERQRNDCEFGEGYEGARRMRVKQEILAKYRTRRGIKDIRVKADTPVEIEFIREQVTILNLKAFQVIKRSLIQEIISISHEHLNHESLCRSFELHVEQELYELPPTRNAKRDSKIVYALSKIEGFVNKIDKVISEIEFIPFSHDYEEVAATQLDTHRFVEENVQDPEADVRPDKV